MARSPLALLFELQTVLRQCRDEALRVQHSAVCAPEEASSDVGFLIELLIDGARQLTDAVTRDPRD